MKIREHIYEFIHMCRNSTGFVYLRFESVTAAVSCQRAMQGRWFAGRSVSATFMVCFFFNYPSNNFIENLTLNFYPLQRPQEYEAKF